MSTLRLIDTISLFFVWFVFVSYFTSIGLSSPLNLDWLSRVSTEVESCEREIWGLGCERRWEERERVWVWSVREVTRQRREKRSRKDIECLNLKAQILISRSFSKYSLFNAALADILFFGSKQNILLSSAYPFLSRLINGRILLHG